MGRYYSAYPESHATTKATASDLIPCKVGGPGTGKVGTYAQPKSGPSRKVHTVIGRRVKTSMLENF